MFAFPQKEADARGGIGKEEHLEDDSVTDGCHVR